MNFFNRAIDNFCNKHRGFGVPRLMLYIVIATGLVFLVGGTGLTSFIVFSPPEILRGQVWRLITWIFIPQGNAAGFGGIFFTLITLYFYYFIGSTLEREWGTAKFTVYYLFGMLLNVLYGFIVWILTGAISLPTPISLLTPMFLNLSMFFAFAVLFPDFTIRLFLIIPIKIKWLAIANGVFFLYNILAGIVTAFTSGPFALGLFFAFMPIVAILNFFLMCGPDLVRLVRPLKARTNPQVIQFRQAAKKAKKEMDDKPYRHKCAVCGKTDIDYPNLEFRYCSQCNGYHCFCNEHINNHIHFE